MNSIDIGCHSGIGFSNSKGNEISEKIWVGNKDGYAYWSYLYFDLSDISKRISLISATITLFKIPIESSQDHCYSPEGVNHYSVIPTVEYVTPYIYCYGIPHAEETLRSFFQVESNLTQLSQQ